ncbi:MAG: O-antigen ligase family protein [bacterium]|nr:O-antigen ligase family protein [bacterium]
MAFSQKRAAHAGGPRLAPFLLISGIVLIGTVIAFALTKTSAFMVIAGLIGTILLAVSFFSPEFGVALLIMSMLLSPEIGAGAAGGGTSVEPSRSVVVRLDDILLVILSAAWFARTAIHKDLGLVRKSPLNRPIGLYVLSCAVSTILGFMAGTVKGKIGTFFVLRYIEYFVVYFMAINFINTRAIIRRFMNIAIITAIVIAAYGVYQIPSGVRVSAPFEGEAGEPNTMGGYLLILMCMAGGQLLMSRRPREIFKWVGYIAFLGLPLLFTGSRSSWLGVPASILAFLLFSHKKKEIFAVVLLLSFSAPALLPESVKERLLFTFKQSKQTRAKQLEVGGVRLDSSTTARLDSWKVAVDGWKQKPILGWGITGMVFIDAQYVRTLAETGLVGMAAFAWLMWAYFQCGIAALRGSPDRYQRGIVLGYLAGLFGLAIHGLGSNTFIILRIMEPWMLFTAIVVVIPEIQERRNKKWEEKEPLYKEAGLIEEETPKEETAPPEAEAPGEEESTERVFEKKLSSWESFLERETIELKRQAIEAEFEKLEKLHFRDPNKTLVKMAAARQETPANGPKPAANGKAAAVLERPKPERKKHVFFPKKDLR